MEKDIKPTFNGKLRIARTLLFTCFMPIIPIFIYIFSKELFDLTRMQAYSFLAFMLFSINALWYLCFRQFYRTISYEIGEDSIVENTNFISASKKEIKYSNIKEITCIKGPLQRFFNLGNIILYTQASSSGGNNHSGMTLLDINAVEDVYDKIKHKMSRK